MSFAYFSRHRTGSRGLLGFLLSRFGCDRSSASRAKRCLFFVFLFLLAFFFVFAVAIATKFLVCLLDFLFRVGTEDVLGLFAEL